MKTLLGRWLPVAVWMGMIYFLSAQSTLPKLDVSWLDEVLRIAGHFFQYAVLGFLLARAIIRDGDASRLKLAWVIAFAVLYALSDEWHQSFVPGRDASVLDVGVDALGVMFASVLQMYFG